ALVGYMFLVVGQWRCLLHAPQSHGAKELQFTCLLCSLAAPVCFVIAHYIGGGGTYVAFCRGGFVLASLDRFHGADLLRVVGLLLFFSSLFLFGAFSRAVDRCLHKDEEEKKTYVFFWFVPFLLGGTFGVFFYARRLPLKESFLGLGMAWMVFFLLHAILVTGVRRSIIRALQRRKSRELRTVAASDPQRGEVALRSSSWFRTEQ